MSCNCDDTGDFLEEWGGGVSVTLTDPEGGTEGRIRLSWAAVLGLLALVLILVSIARED